MEFAQHIVKNPIVIKLLREQESLNNITQYYVRCRDQDEKYQAIQNIYGVITIGQAIIFCQVRFNREENGMLEEIMKIECFFISIDS